MNRVAGCGGCSRRATLVAGVSLVVGLQVAGVQAARASSEPTQVAPAAATPTSPIIPGSRWTFRLTTGPCEIDTFHANGTFTTGSRFGDAGTFRVSGLDLVMRWTRGGDATTRFAGSYDSARHAFFGTWFADGSFPAALIRGATCT